MIFHECPKSIIDITSSDLNEFWIGQKIWRAAPVLFLLSTGFMGVGAKYHVENQKKVGVVTFFSIRGKIAGLRAPAYLLESHEL